MARSFNGSSDVITIAAGFKPVEPLTVSAWIRPTATSGSNTIIGSSTTGNMQVRYNGAASTVTIQVIRENAASIVTSAGTLPLNSWGHVVVTWVHGTQKIYLNNVLDANTGTDTTDISADTYLIGENGAGLTEFFGGSMADLAVWSIALGTTDIANLFNGIRPSSVQSGSLSGWWPLDGFASPETDASGGGNTGTLTGTTRVVGPSQLWRVFGS